MESNCLDIDVGGITGCFRQKRIMEYRIVVGGTDHLPELLALYRRVAAVPGSLIRTVAEIDEAYVGGFTARAARNGLQLIALAQDRVVGEIHAYTPDLYCFRHLLSELTIVVDPDWQGRGIGRALFERFLATVRRDFPHILRVELYVRAHNQRNVTFYESLGFQNEGRQERKLCFGPGHFETPQHMVWFNPGFGIGGKF
jgi:putative acetyltransferase